ncbi:hypothetical protein ACWEJ7_04840 [Streptomyces albidoflavus]
MTTELVVSPRGHRERASLAEAPAWRAYAADLREFLGLVAVRSAVGQFEVTELLVGHPLPDRYGELRNGVQVDLATATDLAERMAAGAGPYCRLTAPGKLRIESGWDGAIHLLMNPAVADAPAGLGGGNLSVERRTSAPEPEGESFVGDVADEEFWNGVRAAAGGLVLLRERWAYGAYGCHWFRVTRENAAQVARTVRPRSLLGVVADPELRLDAAVLEEDFTAFADPLAPGRLVALAYPGGADSLSDVTGRGLSLMVADEALDGWSAVVADPDGGVRAARPSPLDPNGA